MKRELPNLKIKKFKSGKKVFDWRVPDEWNVKSAYIKDKYNKKIIDFKNNNLHLVSYSQPKKLRLVYANLRKIYSFIKINQKRYLTLHLTIKNTGGFVLHLMNLKK